MPSKKTSIGLLTSSVSKNNIVHTCAFAVTIMAAEHIILLTGVSTVAVAVSTAIMKRLFCRKPRNKREPKVGPRINRKSRHNQCEQCSTGNSSFTVTSKSPPPLLEKSWNVSNESSEMPGPSIQVEQLSDKTAVLPQVLPIAHPLMSAPSEKSLCTSPVLSHSSSPATPPLSPTPFSSESPESSLQAPISDTSTSVHVENIFADTEFWNSRVEERIEEVLVDMDITTVSFAIPNMRNIDEYGSQILSESLIDEVVSGIEIGPSKVTEARELDVNIVKIPAVSKEIMTTEEPDFEGETSTINPKHEEKIREGRCERKSTGAILLNTQNEKSNNEGNVKSDRKDLSKVVAKVIPEICNANVYHVATSNSEKDNSINEVAPFETCVHNLKATAKTAQVVQVGTDGKSRNVQPESDIDRIVKAQVKANAGKRPDRKNTRQKRIPQGDRRSVNANAGKGVPEQINRRREGNERGSQHNTKYEKIEGLDKIQKTLLPRASSMKCVNVRPETGKEVESDRTDIGIEKVSNPTSGRCSFKAPYSRTNGERSVENGIKEKTVLKPVSNTELAKRMFEGVPVYDDLAIRAIRVVEIPVETLPSTKPIQLSALDRRKEITDGENGCHVEEKRGLFRSKRGSIAGMLSRRASLSRMKIFTDRKDAANSAGLTRKFSQKIRDRLRTFAGR